MRKLFWMKLGIAGWIIGALPVLLLVFSAIMKLAKPASVVGGFAHLGLPERLRQSTSARSWA